MLYPRVTTVPISSLTRLSAPDLISPCLSGLLLPQFSLTTDATDSHVKWCWSIDFSRRLTQDEGSLSRAILQLAKAKIQNHTLKTVSIGDRLRCY